MQASNHSNLLDYNINIICRESNRPFYYIINLSISNSNSKFNSRRIRYLVTLLYFCEYNFWSLFSLTCSSMIIKEWPTTLGFCDIGNPITAFSIHFSSTHICLDSFSCSFTSISFLTDYYQYGQSETVLQIWTRRNGQTKHYYKYEQTELDE
jgi:hypothetical protein